MHNRLEKSGYLVSSSGLGLLLAVIIVAVPSLLGSTQKFSIPDDLALRIRLDDTLTSTDSQVGDPFSATVVDKGEYQNARVHGHVTEIEMSGKTLGFVPITPWLQNISSLFSNIPPLLLLPILTAPLSTNC
jgi:hypothetical protein